MVLKLKSFCGNRKQYSAYKNTDFADDLSFGFALDGRYFKPIVFLCSSKWLFLFQVDWNGAQKPGRIISIQRCISQYITYLQPKLN